MYSVHLHVLQNALLGCLYEEATPDFRYYEMPFPRDLF